MKIFNIKVKQLYSQTMQIKTRSQSMTFDEMTKLSIVHTNYKPLMLDFSTIMKQLPKILSLFIFNWFLNISVNFPFCNILWGRIRVNIWGQVYTISI